MKKFLIIPLMLMTVFLGFNIVYASSSFDDDYLIGKDLIVHDYEIWGLEHQPEGRYNIYNIFDDLDNSLLDDIGYLGLHVETDEEVHRIYMMPKLVTSFDVWVAGGWYFDNNNIDLLYIDFYKSGNLDIVSFTMYNYNRVESIGFLASEIVDIQFYSETPLEHSFNESNDKAYNNGLKNGKKIGFDDGFDKGYIKGQEDGFDGLSVLTGGIFGFITAFGNIELLPNLKIGYIIGIMLIFGIVGFITNKKQGGK